MKISNVSFPYPVLGVGDDILPMLTDDCISVEISNDVQNYYFDVTLKYDNHEIESFVSEGFAEYTCEIDCVKTLLRSSIPFKEPTFKITLPKKRVNGRVDFSCYISVKKPISNYINSGFNEDYDGYSFDMEPGDILAAFPEFHYDVDIQYDKLQAAGSFMVIREGFVENTKFDFSGSKIEIVLPPALFKIYQEGVGDRFAEIIHSSMAYNALTCALYNINEHKQTTWAKTILLRLATEDELKSFMPEDPDHDASIEDVPSLAMILLRDPYNRMLNFLNNYNSDMEE